MADLTQLARGLESYDKELERHNVLVDEAHQSLRRALARLSTVYEGTGARDFQTHWARTTANFNEYIAGAKAIQHTLNDRIQTLKAADRPDGL